MRVPEGPGLSPRSRSFTRIVRTSMGGTRAGVRGARSGGTTVSGETWRFSSTDSLGSTVRRPVPRCARTSGGPGPPASWCRGPSGRPSSSRRSRRTGAGSMSSWPQVWMTTSLRRLWSVPRFRSGACSTDVLPGRFLRRRWSDPPQPHWRPGAGTRPAPVRTRRRACRRCRP